MNNNKCEIEFNNYKNEYALSIKVNNIYLE